MKHPHSLLVLTSSLLLLLASCDKENESNVTPLDPQAKISRIYRTGSILLERYNETSGNWDTIMDIPSRRFLAYAFTWTGDRIDTIYNMEITYALKYDAAGRLIFANGMGNYIHSYIDYDAEGKISKIDETYFGTDGIDTAYRRLVDYQWTGDKLTGLESQIVYTDPESPHDFNGTQQDMHLFTWTGDNITTSVLYETSFSGVHDTTTYHYDYTGIPNPFYGLAFCQMYHHEFINPYAPTDGFSKYMPSRTYNNNSNTSYEYTLSGGRITLIHTLTTSTTTTAAGTSRQTATSDYEIQYLEQ